MKNDYLKTLWTLRFEKIKKNEEAAAWTYQEILDQCLSAFGDQDPVIEPLRTLVREERMHSKCADELLQRCKKTHPECGL